MAKFKIGDKVRRTAQDAFWVDFCKRHKLNPNGIFTVSTGGSYCISVSEMGFDHTLLGQEFELVSTKKKRFL